MTRAATGAADGRPLAVRPPGVPAEIDVGALGTLVDLLGTARTRHAARPAISCFGSTLTYADLGREADRVTGFLQAEGLAKGDRVAVMLPNVPAYPAILYGALAAGCTVVNVNPLYTPRELSHQVRDAGARVLFVLENFAHTVQAALPDMTLDRVVVVAPGDLLGLKGRLVNFVSRRVKKAVPAYILPDDRTVHFAAALAGAPAPRAVAIAPDDHAFLQYTGGTTGVAKGATLTHRNVAANVEQTRAWFGLADEPATERVMVTALPLYHIFGLTCCFFYMMRIGACCLLIPNPRDIPGFVKTLRAERFTMFAGVNTLFNALLNHPDFAKVDFSRLDHVNAGGMAVQAAVAKRWKAATGRPIIEGYGLSETSPVVCVNAPTLTEWSGTIGYPLPSTEVAIRAADGAAVPAGEAGELCVRGPQVMAGYWKRPEDTARAMTADGFFRTGDVAVLQPDGQVRIVDRMKDMILVSGFNVYPNEVEDVIAEHPGVLETAVVGVPDEAAGETVVAYVVRKDPALTADALRAHCRTGLTGYKVPRRIEFRDGLPKTTVGKVLRRALRDEAAGPG